MRSLVKLFVDKIADQPLPLFDTKTLEYKVHSFPTGLLRSFLALTVRFSDDDFFKNARSRAVEFYKRSAREITFNQIAEPINSLDILQACCLVSLGEIEGRCPLIQVCRDADHC